ncbi:geranylgeranyl reductase family protein [Mycobacterium shinjukuense]|uniref:Menaquinone reductase n=1 Tax=Mycobacterium shinjukuense TaxID=398694 RepID=A0A7I7MX06_9MYCO|nr:geranylgeranyl reductase family protein [Mycobacterium shinjukuense]MCV6983951.1 geranylgeranyl reductase family protein [Mycobacterium shinjukuense]ORB69171.1 FAD-linked oxidoreductase [Mycobacterium shinjukuense]BBX75709.1 menaquinone reductase [Mycobacterium shinjukuense]
MDTSADVVVVGAGPAGSAAAVWAAQTGRDVLVIDASEFPRDKACGDGLTPRAVAELQLLGLGGWLDHHIKHRGLRVSGFGGSIEMDWPAPSFPSHSSAVPRAELDDRLRQTAAAAGASMLLGRKVVDVHQDPAGRVAELVVRRNGTVSRIRCGQVIVADGARSEIGRMLGRRWHRQTVYGVAVRGYLTSPRSDEPLLSTSLDLRRPDGRRLAGYGWIFPLGNGQVNIGVGAWATAQRPAKVALRQLLSHYTNMQRDAWGFDGEPRAVASALLPMGGAASGLAGPNWMLIGDAAACVNPLNGEGIDYGLQSGRLAAGLLGSGDVSQTWPRLLRRHFARDFSIARRFGRLLTVPGFLPAGGVIAMRSATLTDRAVRVMGNFFTDDDADLTARWWRRAGAGSRILESRPPFS